MKWVLCSRERNGVLVKRWKIPYFYWRLKMIYRKYVLGENVKTKYNRWDRPPER